MQNFDRPMIGTLLILPYPLYMTAKVLENPQIEPELVRFWLSFWMIWGGCCLIEPILGWVPFYAEIKIVFLIVLQIPSLNLPTYLYHSYIYPQFLVHESHIHNWWNTRGSSGYIQGMMSRLLMLK
jgi:hypothetical protein